MSGALRDPGARLIGDAFGSTLTNEALELEQGRIEFVGPRLGKMAAWRRTKRWMSSSGSRSLAPKSPNMRWT